MPFAVSLFQKKTTDTRTIPHDLAGGLLVLTYILNTISTNRVQDLHYKLNLLVSQPQISNIEDVIKDLKDFLKGSK